MFVFKTTREDFIISARRGQCCQSSQAPDAGCFPPSYSQFTPEEIELIEIEDRDTIDWTGRHDPMLIRLQRTIGEQVTQIHDYAAALGRAEAFVAERTSELEHACRSGAMTTLAHAQHVVEERNRLIHGYEKGLEHSEQLVIERDAEIRRYAAALEQAQQAVDRLNEGQKIRGNE